MHDAGATAAPCTADSAELALTARDRCAEGAARSPPRCLRRKMGLDCALTAPCNTWHWVTVWKVWLVDWPVKRTTCSLNGLAHSHSNP